MAQADEGEGAGQQRCCNSGFCENASSEISTVSLPRGCRLPAFPKRLFGDSALAFGAVIEPYTLEIAELLDGVKLGVCVCAGGFCHNYSPCWRPEVTSTADAGIAPGRRQELLHVQKLFSALLLTKLRKSSAGMKCLDPASLCSKIPRAERRPLRRQGRPAGLQRASRPPGAISRDSCLRRGIKYCILR